MQALAQSVVSNITQARELIRSSFDVQEYYPRQREPWDDAYERFEKLLNA